MAGYPEIYPQGWDRIPQSNVSPGRRKSASYPEHHAYAAQQNTAMSVGHGHEGSNNGRWKKSRVGFPARRSPRRRGRAYDMDAAASYVLTKPPDRERMI